MIFQHTLSQLLASRKTQTRRLVKDGEVALYNPSGIIDRTDVSMAVIGGETYVVGPPDVVAQAPITAVRTGSGRLKWAVGRTYAVQPGRGQAAVARIRLTGIRLERVQDITEEDAWKEGFEPLSCPVCEDVRGTIHDLGGCLVCGGTGITRTSRSEFIGAWRKIHTRKSTRWADNPQVWVPDFGLVDVHWHLFGAATSGDRTVNWDFTGDASNKLFVIVRRGQRVISSFHDLTEEAALEKAEEYGVKSAMLQWLYA